MRLNKLFKKGFTLVELVVVIAVIAILAAVSVGAYFGVTESAKASKLQSESKQLHDNVLLVANTISDNHKIDSTGLYINDLEVFEEDLEKMSGISYEVYEGEVSSVVGNAIVFKKAATSNAFNETPYVTFQYFTPEVQGSAGSVNVVTGDYEKVTSNVVIENLVKTTSELLAAAENQSASTIKLGANISVDDHLYLYNRNLTLDLNGYNIDVSHKNGITHDDNTVTHDIIGIHVAGTSNVILTGNGSVTISSTCEIENCNVSEGAALIGVYPGSTLTIKNGTYESNGGASVLYTKGSGKTIVEGGTFHAVDAFVGNGRHYTLNIKSEAHNDGHNEFEIKGGKFYHDNPNAWKHDQNHTFDFVPEGYNVVETTENGCPVYTVVKA